jgi:kumamolisin
MAATAFLESNYYEQVLGALALIVVLAMVLERALAMPFEWGPIHSLLVRRSLHTPIAYVAAWVICWSLQFDLLPVLGGKTAAWSGPFSIGTFLTAGVIAGGSKGAILLFQGVLGFGKDAVNARIAASTQAAVASAHAAAARIGSPPPPAPAAALPRLPPPQRADVPAPVRFRHRGRHRTYIKFRKPGLMSRAVRANVKPWDLPALCAAYNWPTGLAGGGTIALVELGGGWQKSDLDLFCQSLGQPTPNVVDDTSLGGRNAFGIDTNADGEVALDIQVAAAAYYAATGKPASIRVYWATNSIGEIAAAVRKATGDGCDVCSISWGADEAVWGPDAAEQMEQAAQAAVAAGMVVFAASGDNDSADGGPTPANVDLPASCPHVIGCGGTTKSATAETVWNDNPGQSNGQGTGGGFSVLFPTRPAWQVVTADGAGRMVPDVAANADPNSGYNIVLGGNRVAVGGTSAVAPLYAGLFAAFGRKLGQVAPTLWQNRTCFNDIEIGDNGTFRAGIGPDPCTGLGSPIGNRLAALFVSPPA